VYGLIVGRNSFIVSNRIFWMDLPMIITVRGSLLAVLVVLVPRGITL
jgi:hypothetical protein